MAMTRVLHIQWEINETIYPYLVETFNHSLLVKPTEAMEDKEGSKIHSYLVQEYHIFSLLKLPKTST